MASPVLSGGRAPSGIATWNSPPAFSLTSIGSRGDEPAGAGVTPRWLGALGNGRRAKCLGELRLGAEPTGEGAEMTELVRIADGPHCLHLVVGDVERDHPQGPALHIEEQRCDGARARAPAPHTSCRPLRPLPIDRVLEHLIRGVGQAMCGSRWTSVQFPGDPRGGTYQAVGDPVTAWAPDDAPRTTRPGFQTVVEPE